MLWTISSHNSSTYSCILSEIPFFPLVWCAPKIFPLHILDAVANVPVPAIEFRTLAPFGDLPASALPLSHSPACALAPGDPLDGPQGQKHACTAARVMKPVLASVCFYICKKNFLHFQILLFDFAVFSWSLRGHRKSYYTNIDAGVKRDPCWREEGLLVLSLQLAVSEETQIYHTFLRVNLLDR